MREIKFRAWNEKLKMMSPAFHLNMEEMPTGYGGEILVNFIDGQLSEMIEKCELMQYTGLKDKNGREIYEGDIVKFHMFNSVGVIEWNKRTAEFLARRNNGWTEFGGYQDMEVIGNIYENPELVK